MTRLDQLTMLYGAEQAPALARRIDEAIARTLARVPTTATREWSERSVWLITYGDQFQDAGSVPLAVLDRFLRTRVDDIVDGVHVLPFYPSSSDGGFAVQDFAAVDPTLGTWDDITHLADGHIVMFDAVINHMSASSQWFFDFLADGEERAGFFRLGDPQVDHSAVVRPRTHPLFTPFTRTDGSIVHAWTTFSTDQVDLDYANPEVLLAVIEVLLDYVARGAGAIRLDAIGFLWKEQSGPSIHLPETHVVIQLIRSCLDELGAGTVLISETNVPHEENISYLALDGSEAEVNAVYQFPLAPLVADAIVRGETSVLRAWADGIDAIVGDGRSFLNFLASHDGIGLRPAEGLLDDAALASLVDRCRLAGGEVSYRSLPDGGRAPYELNTTWFDLMAVDNDETTAIARHLASHAIMLALPGIAAIYAHSLFGSPNDHEGFAASGHARDLNRRRFRSMDELDGTLEDPTSRPARILDGLRTMVAARRASSAFHPEGACTIVDAPAGLFVVDRDHGGERARVIVNVGPEPTDIGGLTEGWRALGPGEPTPATLPGYGSAWLGQVTA